MKEIFIISNHAMFSYGLESLLRQKPDFEIVGQSEKLNAAIDQIKALAPDVVILDTDGPPSGRSKDIVRILESVPGVKIVGLSLQNNNIHIYQTRRWIASGVEDLLEAIGFNNNIHH